MKKSEFLKNVEEVDFADAVCGLMLSGCDIDSEDGLADYAQSLIADGYYQDAITVIEGLMRTSFSGYWKNIGGEPYPINDIEDVEEYLEED